jgi:hypothetical protein
MMGITSSEISKKIIETGGRCLSFECDCKHCPCDEIEGGCGCGENEPDREKRLSVCREYLKKGFLPHEIKLGIALEALEEIAVLDTTTGEFMRAKIAVDISREAIKRIKS